MLYGGRHEKQKLITKQYTVLREKAAEPPFYNFITQNHLRKMVVVDNEYFENKTAGMYHCAACGKALFSSDEKFELNKTFLIGYLFYQTLFDGKGFLTTLA